MSVNYQVSVAFDCMVCFTCNHGQKVWDTLGSVIQVNPPPPSWTVLDAKRQNTFYTSCTGYGPQL